MPSADLAPVLNDSVRHIFASHDLCSLSLCLRLDGQEAVHLTCGLARRAPARPALSDQPYDLASLTKALVASPVAASLVEEGRLDPHAPVAEHLPDVDGRITLAHLLDHTSGLPKWNAFYAAPQTAWGLASTRKAILRAACTVPVEAAPGTAHVYTDIGFLVLLALLERVGGAFLDQLFAQRILGPAGARDLHWGWPMAAATERCPVRGALIEGTVHDLNAAALGGVSTHAGLFGTARSVASLAERLLDAAQNPVDHPGLPGATLARWWRARGVGSHTGGWDTVSRGSYTSTGAFFPDDSVGHLGYTGTSLWMSPSRRAVVVVLTNRIHERDDLTAIRAARPLLHDAVARAMGWDREARPPR